jgi:FkbM family methyltransferase
MTEHRFAGITDGDIRHANISFNGTWLDIAYRKGTWDEAVLDEIFHGDVYRLRDETVRTVIKGGKVLDVGANIGCFAVPCLALGAAHVLCIEPEPQNLKLLRRNLEPWAGSGRVTVMAAAAGDPELGALVWPVGAAGEATTTRERDFDANPVKVHALAEMFPGSTINLLKVDTEGAEYEFLIGADLQRVDRIFAEWHVTGQPPDAYGRLLTHLAYTHSVSAFGRPDTGGMLFAHPYETPR